LINIHGSYSQLTTHGKSFAPIQKTTVQNSLKFTLFFLKNKILQTAFFTNINFFILKNKFMKRTFFISVFSLAAVIMTSCNKDDDMDNNPDTLNASDNNFVVKAAYVNRNIVELGQLALTKSTNDSVKMFAQMVITDHNAAITSLNSLATKYNFSLPSTADSAHLSFKDSLNVYTGYQFDTAYVNGQVRDHQQAVAVFQDEITNGSADSIIAYANGVLPKLQSHLQLADSISSQLQ
jgi:putative membrane protein